MNDILYSSIAITAGIILGTVFFGGLWLTVKTSMKSKAPWKLFLGSAVLRTIIVLIGFYYVSLGNLQRLLICTLGFLIARYVIIRITKPPDHPSTELKKEVSHET